MTEKRINMTVGDIDITLYTAANFDDLLDHYADNHPNDVDLIPYFADLWPSARALAEHLVTRYTSLAGERVLELGCGLGLPSIIAARLGATVTASDYHPCNARFLQRNAQTNSVEIEYLSMDWNQPASDHKYDLILGSDLLYDRRHVPAMVHCATSHATPDATILLADPGRDALQETVDCFHDLGYTSTLTTAEDIYLLNFHRA